MTEKPRNSPNPCVMYELGYADAFLPESAVILLSSSSLDELPFDIKGRRASRTPSVSKPCNTTVFIAEDLTDYIKKAAATNSWRDSLFKLMKKHKLLLHDVVVEDNTTGTDKVLDDNHPDYQSLPGHCVLIVCVSAFTQPRDEFVDLVKRYPCMKLHNAERTYKEPQYLDVVVYDFLKEQGEDELINIETGTWFAFAPDDAKIDGVVCLLTIDDMTDVEAGASDRIKNVMNMLDPVTPSNIARCR